MIEFALYNVYVSLNYNEQCLSNKRIENIIVKRRINVSFVLTKMLPGNQTCTDILLICCTNDKLVFSITVFSITVQPQRWKILREGKFRSSFANNFQNSHQTNDAIVFPLIFLSYSPEYAERGLDEFLFRGVVFYFMTETKVQKMILFSSDFVQRRVI